MTSWYDPELDDLGFPAGPVCEVDGTTERMDGSEYYWHCDRAGTLTVDGTLMCEDHAGERGYGPKQEEYGFDPADGDPVPGALGMEH
jgi:hypothetical protein